MNDQDNSNQKSISLGEKRVRTNFNVSRDDLVTKIKQKTADLIDLVDSIKSGPEMVDGETARCCAIAQTEYESAAHWAVKAATANK